MQAYTHTHKVITNLYKKTQNEEDMKWEELWGRIWGTLAQGVEVNIIKYSVYMYGILKEEI